MFPTLPTIDSFTTGSSRCVGKVTTEEKPRALPKEFSLAQNFPNPFNPETRFDYALPTDEHVTLIVYNALGQPVTTLVNEFQGAGYKSVRFDATDLSTGVYFYRLRAGTFTDVKKMLIAK